MAKLYKFCKKRVVRAVGNTTNGKKHLELPHKYEYLKHKSKGVKSSDTVIFLKQLKGRVKQKSVKLIL